MDDPWQSFLGPLPPAAQLLGRRLLDFDSESGVASLAFHAGPEFTNRHGTIQGGFLAAMLDSAAGAAALASLPPGLTAVTLRLDTSFLKPAPVGPLNATARIVAKDDRDVMVEAALTSPTGETVARATVQLRVRKRQPDPAQATG